MQIELDLVWKVMTGHSKVNIKVVWETDVENIHVEFRKNPSIL